MAWPRNREHQRPFARPARLRSAFTLIEVLVVVSIIALLVAILLPSLRKARDQVKVVACQANLHDFGIAFQQYANDYRGYQPLVCYVGTKIYESDPTSDDNLMTLWLFKYTPNLGTFTCPATAHKLRKPERIDKTTVSVNGVNYIKYDVYTAGELRNDFEFHGQLVTEKISGTKVPVHLNGTSYEYKGWYSDAPGKTTVNWYPLVQHTSTYGGAPRTTGNIKLPWDTWVLKDADEGDGRGDVVGAPPGAANNNLPDAWDNHGKKLTNMLYADGHVVTPPASDWDKVAADRGVTNY